MEKIEVTFECANCHARKKLKKNPDMKSGIIVCPECGTKLRLEFDVTASPQTATAYIAANYNKSKKSMDEKCTHLGQPSEAPRPKVGETSKPDKKTVDIRQQGQQQPGSGYGMPPQGMQNVFITRLGGFRGNTPMEKFKLLGNAITIGREDPSYRSDIMFNHDPEMSRRSVQISMVSDPYYGSMYVLKVLKSTNPVMVGNRPVVIGEEVAIRFGDIIVLGKTRLLFSDR